jgi:hypothetical protein
MVALDARSICGNGIAKTGVMGRMVATMRTLTTFPEMLPEAQLLPPVHAPVPHGRARGLARRPRPGAVHGGAEPADVQVMKVPAEVTCPTRTDIRFAACTTFVLKAAVFAGHTGAVQVAGAMNAAWTAARRTASRALWDTVFWAKVKRAPSTRPRRIAMKTGKTRANSTSA